MKLTDVQVKQYVEAYKEPWDQQLWNLKMWLRSRGYIAYFQRPWQTEVQMVHWRYRREQLINQMYQEYIWTSSLPANGSGSRSSVG